MLAAIWAQDTNGLIGKDDKLPWHLPVDLKFFKQMTENNTIVMGRKTFEGMGKRLLPNRKTIIMTRDQDYQVEGAQVVHTVEAVFEYAAQFEGITFIAGGSSIYQDFLPFCDVLYRTEIEHEFAGDAYFPQVDWDDWMLINVSHSDPDEENEYGCSFETYQRKQLTSS